VTAVADIPQPNSSRTNPSASTSASLKRKRESEVKRETPEQTLVALAQKEHEYKMTILGKEHEMKLKILDIKKQIAYEKLRSLQTRNGYDLESSPNSDHDTFNDQQGCSYTQL
jgi:hypothetical protein